MQTVTDTLVTSTLLYIADAYGAGVYGCASFDDATSTCSTGGVLAPLTGTFQEHPILIVPTILVGAVIIATLILVIKKLVRRAKG